MKIVIIALSALAAFAAFASAGEQKSPYAGQEMRRIKALSAAEVEGLLGGKGLGFAKAAELNHFPGPVHLIEAAPDINLSAGQLAETKRLYAKMKSEAIPLGRNIVALEKKLDGEFAGGAITEGALRRIVGEIARLRGALRTTHLKYHLKTKKILSPHQVARYDRARGYAGDARMSHGRHGAR